MHFFCSHYILFATLNFFFFRYALDIMGPGGPSNIPPSNRYVLDIRGPGGPSDIPPSNRYVGYQGP